MHTGSQHRTHKGRNPLGELRRTSRLRRQATTLCLLRS